MRMVAGGEVEGGGCIRLTRYVIQTVLIQAQQKL